MDDHRDLIEENRAHWDELAEHHPGTDAYDVEAFLEGESSLRHLEREEVDAAGRRLLHLQCHFGLDTLSWVRDEGASHATGVDFSPTAIQTARDLRDAIGLDEDAVRFIESDVYDLPGTLEERFELIVTTYGTIYWLPDLDRWAEVIATHLEPGGPSTSLTGTPLSRRSITKAPLTSLIPRGRISTSGRSPTSSTAATPGRTSVSISHGRTASPTRSGKS